MRSNWDDGRKRRYRSGSPWLPFDWSSIPVTRGILIAAFATFLIYFFTGQGTGFVGEYVPFVSGEWMRVWTWFTYPFLEVPTLANIFWVMFMVMTLYSIGGSLERSWGSLNYLALFFAFTAIGAVVFIPLALLTPSSVVLIGFTLPLISIVTAWAALDPDLELSYWGLPIKAKFLALVYVLLAWFQYGVAWRNPLLALLCLAGPVAAILYVRHMPRLNLAKSGLSLPRRSRPERPPRLLREEFDDEMPERERVPGSPRNPLRRRQEQLEIERLKKLLGEDD